MAKSKTHDQVIETFCSRRRGWMNDKTATQALTDLAGLDPGVANALLTEMKRHNVTQIRGYSKEPERLARGKKGTKFEVKK